MHSIFRCKNSLLHFLRQIIEQIRSAPEIGIEKPAKLTGCTTKRSHKLCPILIVGFLLKLKRRFSLPCFACSENESNSRVSETIPKFTVMWPSHEIPKQTSIDISQLPPQILSKIGFKLFGNFRINRWNPKLNFIFINRI